MGTNYYWKEESKPPCKCCGRPYVNTVNHIGKSSAGWTFTFHATDEIRSYKDWLKKMESETGIIEDEYGNIISLEDFKKMIEKKKSSKMNHTIYCKEKYRYSDQDTWLDKEGHSFSVGEFS